MICRNNETKKKIIIKNTEFHYYKQVFRVVSSKLVLHLENMYFSSFIVFIILVKLTTLCNIIKYWYF